MTAATYSGSNRPKSIIEQASVFTRFLRGTSLYADTFSDNLRMTQLIEAGMPIEQAYEIAYGQKPKRR